MIRARLFLPLMITVASATSVMIAGCATKSADGTPASSTGSLTIAYAGSNLVLDSVAAECGIANGKQFCGANWLSVVTTTGGPTGDHLIVNSFQFLTDEQSWTNGTLAETTGASVAKVGALAYFIYHQDFGPGGASGNPTNEAALVSSGGASFTLTNVSGTADGSSYEISSTGPGVWLKLVGTTGETPSPSTSFSGAEAAGVLDSGAF